MVKKLVLPNVDQIIVATAYKHRISSYTIWPPVSMYRQCTDFEPRICILQRSEIWYNYVLHMTFLSEEFPEWLLAQVSRFPAEVTSIRMEDGELGSSPHSNVS